LPRRTQFKRSALCIFCYLSCWLFGLIWLGLHLHVCAHHIYASRHSTLRLSTRVQSCCRQGRGPTLFVFFFWKSSEMYYYLIFVCEHNFCTCSFSVLINTTGLLRWSTGPLFPSLLCVLVSACHSSTSHNPRNFLFLFFIKLVSFLRWHCSAAMRSRFFLVVTNVCACCSHNHHNIASVFTNQHISLFHWNCERTKKQCSFLSLRTHISYLRRSFLSREGLNSFI
jgi:hypothetical protein